MKFRWTPFPFKKINMILDFTVNGNFKKRDNVFRIFILILIKI